MLQETTMPVVDERDSKKFVFHETLFRRTLVGSLRAILPALIDVKVQGLNNIREEGPLILASNHLTNYDVFPLQLVIRRPLFFMAKSELHRNMLMDITLRSLGAFPVHRDQRDEWAMNHANKVLQHGQLLALFPEGTRSKGSGLKPGKTGAARLAISNHCPIIPVAVNGSQQMFHRFPRRTVITITVGKEIYPQEHESALGLTDRLMFAIADMLPVELRGVYSKRPLGFKLEGD